MDISVSRLNSRLVLQVPAELPLGLVFITGTVEALRPVGDRIDVLRFDLVERKNRLACRIPRTVAEETLLQEGDRVRVSGRLVFAGHSVQYSLLARDLEVLPRRTSDGSLQTVLADARQRRQQTSLAQPELPPWVQRLAPPELRHEIEDQEAAQEQAEGATSIDDRFADAVPGLEQLPQELVTFLAGALDSDSDVELTAEMIATYLPEEEATSTFSEGEQLDSLPRHQPMVAEEAQPADVVASAEEQTDAVFPERVQSSVPDQNAARAPRSEWIPRLEIAAIVILTLLLVASMVTLILLLTG
jgi:hypothetical protein